MLGWRGPLVGGPHRLKVLRSGNYNRASKRVGGSTLSPWTTTCQQSSAARGHWSAEPVHQEGRVPPSYLRGRGPSSRMHGGQPKSPPRESVVYRRAEFHDDRNRGDPARPVPFNTALGQESDQLSKPG